MIVYHELQPSSVQDILSDGLKRTSRGEKGADPLIKLADELLDQRRPEAYREKDISRDDNIYAYVEHGGQLVDITDGSLVPLRQFIETRDQALLRLKVDPKRCYVSDLDRFDRLKQALEHGESDKATEDMADSYWQALTPLVDFTHGEISRPEIMITYDIAPSEIERVG